MQDNELYLHKVIYDVELERVCGEYLSAVDNVIPREGELDGDINTPYNQALLYQLKDIARAVSDRKEAFERFRKRIYFLEVRGVQEPELLPEIEDKSEEYLKACEAYRRAVALLSCKDEPISEVVLPQEIFEMIEDKKFFECDTLVGTLRSPRQIGICLKRKFYHIPAKQIEEHDLPKYVAIYQSERMFGEELSGIKYYGEIKRCVRLRRSRIREIPKSSNEMYYKFKVRKWERLENPIAAKEIGFVRLFTSFSLLKNSKEVPELTFLDKEEFVLYRLMTLANAQIQANPNKAFCGFRLSDFDILVGGKFVYLCKGGRALESYRRASFPIAPSAFVKEIRCGMKRYF